MLRSIQFDDAVYVASVFCTGCLKTWVRSQKVPVTTLPIGPYIEETLSDVSSYNRWTS